MSKAPAGQRDRGEAAAGPGADATGPAAADRGPAPAGRSHVLLGYLPVVLVAAAMLVMGLWGLKRHSSMGNDEVVSRWAALLPLRELFRLLSHVDAVHGFYYFLLHGWMAVGTSPAVMRIPSVIAMTVAAGLVAIITRRLTRSGWAALFAGLIMAFTPVISFYGQTARSYAMVMATVLGATLTLLHALKGETTGASARSVARRWVGYGALIALAGYLNEMALLMLAAHGATVLLARYGRAVLRHWFIAGAVGALLVTPLLLVSAREASAVGWIPYPHLWMLKVLFHDYFGPVDVVALLLFCFAVAAVLPPIRLSPAPASQLASSAGEPASNASVPASAAGDSASAAREPAGGAAEVAELPWWRTGGVSLPSVAVPLLVLPGALLLLESVIARPLYVDRYVLYGEAGAAMLAGAGVFRVGRWLSSVIDKRFAGKLPANKRVLLVAPGVLLCALTLVLQLTNQRDVRTAGARLFDFGGPSRYVAAQSHVGDGVLYFTEFFRKAELGYPQDYAKVTDFSLARSPAVTGTFTGSDKPISVVRRLMLGYRRIWVLGRGPAAALPTSYLRSEKLWLASHFRLVRAVKFKGVVVSLWVRDPTAGLPPG